MIIEHPDYININSLNNTKSTDEDSFKETFNNSSISNAKFSSLPTSDVILVHEDDNLAVDVDQNFPTGIKLT